MIKKTFKRAPVEYNIMRLTEEVFKIDAKKVSERIEKFIREKMRELNKEGIVVPISGGLDSSVVASLCVKAVGKDKVKGLILPEREGNPEAEKYAMMIAEFLKIKTKKIDISDTLKALGTYNFILSYVPYYKLKKSLVKSFFKISSKNPFEEGIKGTKDRLIKKGLASFYSKQRIRLVYVYKFAEENNLLAAGSAHKSEDLLGLFVKFGVDDNADIMPIKNLFRAQIIQIGEFFKLPEEIQDRTPNPDIIPGIEDKYFDILGIKSETMDLILYGLENNMPDKKIARQLGLEEKKIKEIRNIVKFTAHMRNPSLAPNI